MVANPVLVDSSYYIALAREGRDPLRELAVVGAQRDIATCGVVRCEVGRGIKAEATLERFRRAWEVMMYVPTDNRLWGEVEQTLWQLDRRGICLPLTDVVIACCARRIQALVLTFDHHFQQIPGIRAVSELL
jgi:predicted nucleic acid-binding protein